jgi:rSAM/selenodomain-associated transferase 1
MPGECRVVVMARAPVAGAAKTRLIPVLGAQGAARLQARLTRHTLAAATQAGIGQVTLACAPDARHAFFRTCAQDFGVDLADQHGDDLGSRMADAFQCLLPESPVILIGTDCPALTFLDLRLAWDALQFHDAVLTPAEDGGYVLIGLRRFAPALFEGVAWGTDAVLAQTRERLVGAGWRWDETPVRWDVDRPDDLARLRRSGLVDIADLGGHEGRAQ